MRSTPNPHPASSFAFGEGAPVRRRLPISLVALALLVPLATAGLVVGPLDRARAESRQGWFSISCPFSHFRQVDPIVEPGVEPSMHMHTFFGNTSTNANSTYDSMVAASTTCHLSADKAGYWIPALTSRATGALVTPYRMKVYYYNNPVAYSTTVPFPPDFRMVAGGDPPNPNSYWNCTNENNAAYHATPPNCGPTAYLRLHVRFPNCWDGVHTDSPDHRSHVVYPVGGKCPTDHKVKLPRLLVNVGFPVHDGTQYILSNGSLTPHADFWNTWSPQSKLDELVKDCLDAGVVCGEVSDVDPSGSVTSPLIGSSPSTSASPSASPSDSAHPSPSPSPTSPASSSPAGADPVIAAAGDISCRRDRDGLASCRDGATSSLVLSLKPTAVLTLGNAQYPDGSLADYRTYFDPTWGRLKSRIHPTPGNHDYMTAGAAGYFRFFGATAGNPARGYYSFDLGSWHIISLNSNCSQVGGCGEGSPQARWLAADLAAHPAACTLAYWHHPRFSSGPHGEASSMSPIWDQLYAAGVDVVLNAHDRDYERFAPQDPRGASDPLRGIREFVIGTGGRSHDRMGPPVANSVVRDAHTFGVLVLVLHRSSYDWRFVPEPGGRFTDTGRATCH